jgi:hypothetical protein
MIWEFKCAYSVMLPYCLNFAIDDNDAILFVGALVNACSISFIHTAAKVYLVNIKSFLSMFWKQLSTELIISQS